MATDTASNPVTFGKAIADETRQRIMAILCCQELCVSDIVNELGGVSQPTVSHHLQILKTAGLVDTRRDGKQIYYVLRQAAIADCCGVIVERFAPEMRLTILETPEDSAQE
jgi:DNA-binding transcriptional ArsR family regulator